MDAVMDQRSLLLERARAMKPLIQQHEDVMEKERRLPEVLRRAFLDAGFYNMWVPREFGGIEVDPITYFEVIEEISSVSGSAGWNLMLGSSFGIFAASLPQAAARDVYTTHDCILAGQINGVTGRAIVEPGGYRVTGKWSFGSGILQSTHVLSNVFIYDGDKPRLDAAGKPVARFFFVPRSQVQIHDTWFTMGLCGTGSNDYSIENVFVPEDYVFERGRNIYLPGPLYKLVMAFGYTIPLPLVGIARGAIDAFKEFAQTRKSRTGALLKDSEVAQYEIARAEGLLAAGRAVLWSIVREMYETAMRGETITQAQEDRASVAQVEAGQLAAAAVDIVFDACGGTAVYKSHPVERRFRDAHTARQHAAIGRNKRQMIGQQMLAG